MSENVTSNGKIELGGAVSILNDSSVIFKNKETQAETEGEYIVDENGVFLIPKTRLDEGVEYEINVRADSDINLKTIDFDGNNVVKVLYDVYAELDNNENSVNYKLKNRLEQPMEAQFVVIKYNGLKMSSLEFETISHILIFSSSVSKHVSMITFKILSPQAFLSVRISLRRKS